MKRVVLSAKTCRAYQAATHSRQPQSISLTWWQQFRVPELAGRRYFLVEQQIQSTRLLIENAWYWVSLTRLLKTTTSHGEIWRYRLTVPGFLTADTTIYVQEDAH